MKQRLLSVLVVLVLAVGCSDSEPRVFTVRYPEAPSALQKDIDAVRQEQKDSATWGQTERKEWEERYQGESSATPYQGPAVPYAERMRVLNEKQHEAETNENPAK